MNDAGSPQLTSEQLNFILQSDSIALMDAKEQKSPFKLAPIWKRVLARAIDFGIVYIITSIFLFFIIVIGFSTIPEESANRSFLDCFQNRSFQEIRQNSLCNIIFEPLKIYFSIGIFLNTLFIIAYFTLLPIYGRFGTVGKAIMSIKIITDNKTNISVSPLQNLTREIFFNLLHISILIKTIDSLYFSLTQGTRLQYTLTIIQLLIIGIILYSIFNMIMSPKSQSINDKMVNTLVVES
jgi:uncharacterized RDD family membrane protein YckC